MAKLSLTDIQSGYAFIATYNANNALVEAALENTLSRDGTTPNTLSAAMDMNSQLLTNLADAVGNQDAVTLKQLQTASIVSSTIAATLVTVADAGALYSADTLEAALAEIRATPTATDRNAIELATQAEVDTGTDAVRAVTPATLENKPDALPTQIKVKTADETVSSNTTPQADNHLVGFTLDADSYYKFEMHLSLTHLGGDISLRWNFSNTAQVTQVVGVGCNNIGTASIQDSGNGMIDVDGIFLLNITNEGTKFGFILNGMFRTNATTGGTLDFKWAQRVSDSDVTTLHEGTWMSITKIQ